MTFSFFGWSLVKSADLDKRSKGEAESAGKIRYLNKINKVLSKLPLCPECEEPILMLDVPLHPKNDCKYNDGVIMALDVYSKQLHEQLRERFKGFAPLIEVLRELRDVTRREK